MRPPHPHLTLILLLTPISSCATHQTSRITAASPVTPPSVPALVRDEAGVDVDEPVVLDFSLPDGWRSLARDRFAVALEGWLDGRRPVRVQERGLAVLEVALRSGDESSVRAAVILARTLDPRAGEVLIARLEQRVETASSASDVVAAAAFVRGTTARDAAARLDALASGKVPHPVLEVRIECAASALGLGRDGSIAFLLDVLREGTSFAVAKPDWKRIDWTSARSEHAQRRAALALSSRAGIPCTYRVEASMASRESEVTRLAQILGSVGSKKK